MPQSGLVTVLVAVWERLALELEERLAVVVHRIAGGRTIRGDFVACGPQNSVRAGFRVDVTLLHRNRVLVCDFLRSTGAGGLRRTVPRLP